MTTPPSRYKSRPAPAADPARGDRFGQQRERIVDAATALLNRRGVRGMTFVEVARALGLTTTSVTYYFRYKEQLAAAVFDDTLDRLGEMARLAAAEPSPRARVARYLGLHVAHHARALRGEARPLAILSEIRALEDATRRALVARYQEIFRAVRGFFGPPRDAEQKALFGARAQMVSEAIYWSAIWLDTYPISAFEPVRARMLDIFEHGLAGRGLDVPPALVDPGDAGEGEGARSAFLRVATRLINDSGYRGASVERIVAELKVTKGSFYHHLSAKDDLVLACFRHSYRRVMLNQSLAAERGGDRLQQLATGIASALRLQFDGDYPLLRVSALQALPAAVRDVAVARANRIAACYAGLLVEGMRDGSIRIVDPMIASQIIFSTIDAAYDMRGWAARLPPGSAIALYAAPLLHGLFDG